jgi:type I restriction enzyme S subunit
MKSGSSIIEQRIHISGKDPCYGGNGLRGYTDTCTHNGEYTLIGRQGALCGNTIFVVGNFYASEHAIVVTPFDNTNIKFIYYLFNSMNLNCYSESSAQPGLSVNKLLELFCTIPNNKIEQIAIAEVLSDTDKLITSLEKLLEKKKAIKQGTMQELLTGKRRLPGFSGEWELKKMDDIYDIVSGGTPSTSNLAYWNGDILWCTPTDIISCKGKYIFNTEKYISKLELNNSSATLLPVGALLLCSRATIGDVRIAKKLISTNQGFKSLIPNQGILNEWLYYVILIIKNKMLEKAIGSTFLEISKGDLSRILLNVPEFAEQSAIATVFSDMDAEIEALEKKLEKYRQIKQGMMQELLTGKIRLVQPEQEEVKSVGKKTLP